MARTGRRRGESGTREAILEAARDSFALNGFAGTSVRGVAREAGVDPALVHHYFGSKDDLFATAMELPVNPSQVLGAVLDGGIEGLGERLVRLFLDVWDSDAGRRPLVALLQSATSHERAATMVREFVGRVVIGRIAAALDRDDAELRATLVGSQMVGLAVARYVLRIEPLASSDHDTVVAALAPTVQRYLTGDIAGSAVSGAGESATAASAPP